jgi:hypothetical protein
MADIKIDKNLFQERLAHLISTWKADKRNGDALFNGANSILVLMGKSEEGANFQKNNAMHVSQIKLQALFELKLTFGLVLVAWLRIPCYALPFHSRWALRSHNCEERYGITCEYLQLY